MAHKGPTSREEGSRKFGMKGFGIEIKNELLEPKHIEAMGSAVWLYMWLVDKMTSINEAGVGKVLGGRPVKYEEVKEELGIHQNTYTQWIEKLLEYPYIETDRAPYGIVFRVLKAHKRFTKISDSQKSWRDSHKSGRDSHKHVNVIKTIQDNNKDRDYFRHLTDGERKKSSEFAQKHLKP